MMLIEDQGNNETKVKMKISYVFVSLGYKNESMMMLMDEQIMMLRLR